MTLITTTPIPADARFTPDDLLRLPDAVNYELVDGKLVERHMGMRSSLVGLQIGKLISVFLDANPMGFAFAADASYQCFADAPEKVRKPDVSFIRKGRLPNDAVPDGHSNVHPDLAVEVLSPNDLAYDVNEKVGEYLKAGVPLVWVVDPHSRTVLIVRSPSSPRGSGNVLTDTETITGEDILPGFAHPVADFFK
jgi:Uma2 family endonuclease